MKRILFFVTLLLTLMFPQSVFAHVLKYDGSIGAVIHLSPEDDPIAGEVSNFFFEFKDKNDKFSPENCDCLIKINKDNKEILSQNLFEDNFNPSLDNVSFSYTFPSLGIYYVTIEGKSKDNSFNDFSLKYDIRVARSSESVLKSETVSEENWFFKHQLHLIIPGVIFLLIATNYLLKRKKKS